MKQNKSIEKERADFACNGEDEFDIVEYDEYEHDAEVWADYFSDELVTSYHNLTDWFQSMGMPVLDACTFPDYVSFCYRFSSGKKPPC